MTPQKITQNICKKLVEKFSNISLFSLSRNFGEHNAILAGLNQCIGDQAVIMSDDLQHTSEALIELINYGLKRKKITMLSTLFMKQRSIAFIKNFLANLMISWRIIY